MDGFAEEPANAAAEFRRGAVAHGEGGERFTRRLALHHLDDAQQGEGVLSTRDVAVILVHGCHRTTCHFITAVFSLSADAMR